MPRKRQIDPGIWTSEQFINLADPWAKLLFIGMFSNADDEGRMKASLTHLKAVIFPADNVTVEQMKRWRDMVEEQGLCHAYSVNGTEYLLLPTFGVHQYISKPYPSRIPAPFPNRSLNVPKPFHPNGTVNGIDNEDEVDSGKVSRVFHGINSEISRECAIKDGEIVSVSLVWKKALIELKGLMTASNYQTWVTGSVGVGINGSCFVVAVKNTMTCEAIMGRLKPRIEKVLMNVTGRLYALQVQVLDEDPVKVFVSEVIEEMCQNYNVSKVELLRGNRTPEVVIARREIAKCLDIATNLSLLEIGRRVGVSGARRGAGAFDF